MAKKKTTKYYIAYGSNMDVSQMAYRCPEATLVGLGEITGWEYLFKGSLTGSYATIERKKGTAPIPVYVWEVTEADERSLDRYEGYPNFYYKKDIRVKLHSTGKNAIGMVYIMHEERSLGIPSLAYIRTCEEGYRNFGFDTKFLDAAYEISAKEVQR